MTTRPHDIQLELVDLKVYFPVLGGVLRRQIATVKAVDGISLAVKKGETLGLVGESGCGKSTTGKAIIQLCKPTDGNVLFLHQDTMVDLAGLSRSLMKPYRASIQMIFQDPFSSLNPRMMVADIIEEPMGIHFPELSRTDKRNRCLELMEKCGLRSEQASRYPHEFSGGQRQRIGIARSLATHPSLIIADEPVSALDVSVQAQVINLMQDLQAEFNLTYIFIAHDLSVVKHISNRIAVMYLGSIVEIGDSDDVYFRPRHPYSKALLSAVPRISKNKKPEILLEGDVPTPINKPSGCCFRTRCPIARKDCADRVPELMDKGNGHGVACPYV